MNTFAVSRGAGEAAETTGDLNVSGYPEWDYWKQAVLGQLPAVDPDLAYRELLWV